MDEQEARRRRSVGNRIKARRKSLGLTDADLAARATLSRSYVTRIQNGSARGSLDAIERLADALGCDVGYIVGNDAQRPMPNGSCEHCGYAPLLIQDADVQLDERFALNITGDSLTVQSTAGGSFIIRLRGEMLMVHAVPGPKLNGVDA